MSKQFPYGAWVLQPSLKPKKVTITEPCYDPNWHKSESGKTYPTSSIYQTRNDALSAGWEAIITQQGDIDKRQKNLDKRKAALVKAEKDTA